MCDLFTWVQLVINKWAISHSGKEYTAPHRLTVSNTGDVTGKVRHTDKLTSQL